MKAMTSSQAGRLLADLGSLLEGNLARFARGLVVESRSTELRFDALFTPSLIDDHVEHYYKEYGHTDRRAIFSIWALRHFQAVLPPLLLANILFDRSPVLDFEVIAFVMAGDLTVRELRIGPDIVDLHGASGIARFRGLVQSFMSPLIERISVRTAVGERVLWNNAGTTFEGFLGLVEAVAGDRTGFHEGKALLQAPTWPDGTVNRLFSPVRYTDGRRIRRICCMRYLVPDGRLCEICPLNANHRARRR